MSVKLAKRRFSSIMSRNYIQKLNYFLYEVYIKEKKIEDLDTTQYEFDDNIQKEYKKLYYDMTKIRERNKFIKKIIDDNKDDFKKDKKLYFQHYMENILTFSDFKIFWNKENRSCQYCGISENQIEILDTNSKIQTKRFYSRGRTMEIDKIDAFGEYRKGNIILSCYWCNNAKTDEFLLDDFKFIAKGINLVWNKRLNSETAVKFPEETYIKKGRK